MINHRSDLWQMNETNTYLSFWCGVALVLGPGWHQLKGESSSYKIFRPVVVAASTARLGSEMGEGVHAEVVCVWWTWWGNHMCLYTKLRINASVTVELLDVSLYKIHHCYSITSAVHGVHVLLELPPKDKPHVIYGWNISVKFIKSQFAANISY